MIDRGVGSRDVCTGHARRLGARAIFAVLLAAYAGPTWSQQRPKEADPQPPVIACASLANLRAVLRTANDAAAAAVPIITDPGSDLGCSVLDASTVTGVADQVALGGRSYECLAQKGTSVCHWTVAGSVSAPQGKSRH